jgi:two-component sensor histidine kinase
MEKDLAEIRASVIRLGKDRVPVDTGKKAILRALSKLETKELAEGKIQKKNLLRIEELLEVVQGITSEGYAHKTRKVSSADPLDALASGISKLGEILKSSVVSIHEKEVLLKEIHHRVKNNLQVISSLLSLQCATITDAEAGRKFLESCNRIRTMAMVHEKLYMGKDLSRIDMEDYLHGVIGYLSSCYSFPQKGIELNVNIHIQHTLFTIDEAVPMGLILNELLSNSSKYAFSKTKGGKLEISFKEKKGRAGVCVFTLLVKDNGKGLPAGLDIHQTSTLGLQLVSILTEQIGGKIIVGKAKGASFEITFRKEVVGS